MDNRIDEDANIAAMGELTGYLRHEQRPTSIIIWFSSRQDTYVSLQAVNALRIRSVAVMLAHALQPPSITSPFLKPCQEISAAQEALREAVKKSFEDFRTRARCGSAVMYSSCMGCQAQWVLCM